MDIDILVKQSFSNALVKGWHDTERGVPELLCLIHSEISEALEEHRNGREPNEIYFNSDKPDKPEGIPIELADAIIRIADFCGLHNIDLSEAIKVKHNYNKTRTYRHGQKIC